MTRHQRRRNPALEMRCLCADCGAVIARRPMGRLGDWIWGGWGDWPADLRKSDAAHRAATGHWQRRTHLDYASGGERTGNA